MRLPRPRPTAERKAPEPHSPTHLPSITVTASVASRRSHPGSARSCEALTSLGRSCGGRQAVRAAAAAPHQDPILPAEGAQAVSPEAPPSTDLPLAPPSSHTHLLQQAHNLAETGPLLWALRPALQDQAVDPPGTIVGALQPPNFLVYLEHYLGGRKRKGTPERRLDRGAKARFLPPWHAPALGSGTPSNVLGTSAWKEVPRCTFVAHRIAAEAPVTRAHLVRCPSGHKVHGVEHAYRAAHTSSALGEQGIRHRTTSVLKLPCQFTAHQGWGSVLQTLGTSTTVNTDWQKLSGCPAQESLPTLLGEATRTGLSGTATGTAGAALPTEQQPAVYARCPGELLPFRVDYTGTGGPSAQCGAGELCRGGPRNCCPRPGSCSLHHLFGKDACQRTRGLFPAERERSQGPWHLLLKRALPLPLPVALRGPSKALRSRRTSPRQ